MFRRTSFALIVVTMVGACAAIEKDHMDTELWTAVEHAADVNLFEQAGIEKLLGVPLQRVERKYFTPGNPTHAFVGTSLTLSPFDHADYEIFRQPEEERENSGDLANTVDASATLTLWLDLAECYPASIVLGNVDPMTFSRVANDHSQDDRSITSAAGYLVRGKRLEFGFRKSGESECVRYLELAGETRRN
jgi:hypothetical protein